MGLKIGAAYLRVSDERQDEYSPDSQLKLIQKFAKEHDFIVPKEYIFYDDGISAKSTKRRKEFNRMIALAKQDDHPFDAIFVWKFSRFARNQEESIVYKSLLKKKGVSVISISEPVIDDVFGSLIERIIEWMDEYYLIRLSSEVKRGMTEKATRGEAMCHPAFGYDLRNKQYYPNDEAIYVKKIFNDYVAGKGAREIALELADMGVRTHRGNPPDNRFVDYVLHNPVYVGKIRWSTEGRAASRRHYNDPNTIIVDGKHEPIIDDDTFNKAGEVSRVNKMKYGKYQRKSQDVQFMLKGLMRCGDCGATLVMQATACPSVQCHNYARGSCKVSHSISVAKANRTVIEGLKKAVNNLSFNVEFRASESNLTAYKDFEKLIAAEERKLEKIKSAYIDGIDTIEEYKANKVKVLQAIEQLQAEQAEAVPQTEEFKPKEYAKKVSNVIDILEAPDSSEALKNEALRSIVSKIVFNKKPDSLDIFFYA